jgi:hypothetical protein
MWPNAKSRRPRSVRGRRGIRLKPRTEGGRTRSGNTFSEGSGFPLDSVRDLRLGALPGIGWPGVRSPVFEEPVESAIARHEVLEHVRDQSGGVGGLASPGLRVHLRVLIQTRLQRRGNSDGDLYWFGTRQGTKSDLHVGIPLLVLGRPDFLGNRVCGLFFQIGNYSDAVVVDPALQHALASRQVMMHLEYTEAIVIEVAETGLGGRSIQRAKDREVKGIIVAVITTGNEPHEPVGLPRPRMMLDCR